MSFIPYKRVVSRTLLLRLRRDDSFLQQGRQGHPIFPPLHLSAMWGSFPASFLKHIRSPHALMTKNFTKEGLVTMFMNNFIN